MNEIALTTAYAVYLIIIIVLTYLVARNLFKNGKVFMLDIFNGRESIAFATNRLFEMGFYLINLGFGLLILEMYAHNNMLPLQDAMEKLSQKIGGFSIYLGVMLFLNLMMFFRGKRKSKQRREQQDRIDFITNANAQNQTGQAPA